MFSICAIISVKWENVRKKHSPQLSVRIHYWHKNEMKKNDRVKNFVQLWIFFSLYEYKILFLLNVKIGHWHTPYFYSIFMRFTVSLLSHLQCICTSLLGLIVIRAVQYIHFAGGHNVSLPISHKYVFLTPILMSDKYLTIEFTIFFSYTLATITYIQQMLWHLKR